MTLSNETSSKALYKLASFLYAGKGFAYSDKRRAINFFIKASNLGDANSSYVLGVLYEEGIEVEKNIDLSAQYYLKSKQEGNVDAKVNLALLKLGQQKDKNTFDSYQTNHQLVNTMKGNSFEDTRDELNSISPSKLISEAAM